MTTKKSEKTLLSTQGYRGTRDFFPPEQRLQSYIYQQIHTVLKSFGYEEYDGPFVESLELYASKSSEEIVREQLYSFTDKGERMIAIRPEMTPTLARMVASKQRELSRPIRWYSIPTCMRFERPQRGRLREFDQLNVDVFGGNPLDEDIEVLLTLVEIFKKLGASTDDFVIKVNHRGIVNSFLTHVLQASEDNSASILRLLDKKNKLTSEVFVDEAKKLALSDAQIQKLVDFVGADINGIIAILSEHLQSDLLQEMKVRIDSVNSLTQSQCVQFAPDIMRGFDYYTGMVFEVFDTHPDNRRALCGGGRYDDLVSAFGGEALSGIGYGMGDVALLNFIETHQLTPVLKKESDVCVLRFSEQDREIALRLSAALRGLNLNVENCVTLSKFGKQIQYAEKIGVNAVVFCGDEEIKKNKFSVKWLNTGAQESFDFNADGLNLFHAAFLKSL